MQCLKLKRLCGLQSSISHFLNSIMSGLHWELNLQLIRGVNLYFHIQLTFNACFPFCLKLKEISWSCRLSALQGECSCAFLPSALPVQQKEIWDCRCPIAKSFQITSDEQGDKCSPSWLFSDSVIEGQAKNLQTVS